MKHNFRKGQRVVCVHYKDRPVVIVDEVLSKDDQLWVRSTVTKPGASDYWYGPLKWFKPLKKRVQRKPLTISKLCDSNILGCTCNQSASVAQ